MTTSSAATKRSLSGPEPPRLKIIRVREFVKKFHDKHRGKCQLTVEQFQLTDSGEIIKKIAQLAEWHVRLTEEAMKLQQAPWPVNLADQERLLFLPFKNRTLRRIVRQQAEFLDSQY